MVVTGKLDKIPKRKGNNKKYPWEVLREKGYYFIWDNKDEANRIRAASARMPFKITVKIQNEKLQVIRID